MKFNSKHFVIPTTSNLFAQFLAALLTSSFVFSVTVITAGCGTNDPSKKDTRSDCPYDSLSPECTGRPPINHGAGPYPNTEPWRPGTAPGAPPPPPGR